jgi:hypothetical protein
MDVTPAAGERVQGPWSSLWRVVEFMARGGNQGQVRDASSAVCL